MDPDDSTILLSLYAWTICAYMAVRKRRIRRFWVRPIYQKRVQQGDYHNLIQEMRLTDPDMFFNYTRMNVQHFDELLALVGPSLKKRSIRTPLSPGQRLSITLRFLATGDSMQSIALAFRIARCTAGVVIHETCRALWNVLQPIYLRNLQEEDWHQISQMYGQMWNFPHCLGAIDGKHIQIQAPNKSGSLHYNYKQFFSIVLLAVSDAKYKFTMIDVGAYGSQSDGGILAASHFGQDLFNGRLQVPEEDCLPGSNTLMPYFFVGDEAFPLKTFLMRPYSGRNLLERKVIFNYRLSRARRVIENTFGILVSRWRIFRGTIMCDPKNVDAIVQACVCLHNYIKSKEELITDCERRYCPSGFVDVESPDGSIVDGDWRNIVRGNGGLQPTGRVSSNYGGQQAICLRDSLAEYLNSDIGSCPWQLSHINRGREPTQQ